MERSNSVSIPGMLPKAPNNKFITVTNADASSTSSFQSRVKQIIAASLLNTKRSQNEPNTPQPKRNNEQQREMNDFESMSDAVSAQLQAYLPYTKTSPLAKSSQFAKPNQISPQ